MSTTRTDDATLVAAARAGDPRAREELVQASLPLVYTLVRRALPDPDDADDVAQDVLLAALRDLPQLQDPARFRAWLTVIAVRRISAHRERGERREIVVDLREFDDVPDEAPAPDDRAAARADLSVQRRRVAAAARWLDPDDRVLLSLWWLETADRLTRAELATAVGVSQPHAAVRVQRMRGQLDVARGVVAALEASPRCRGLSEAAARWDGVPSPLWRKRLARHVRSCATCRRAAGDLVAAEWLLAGVGLLPVPFVLGAAVLAKASAAAPVGVTLAAHSVAATSAPVAADPTLVWRAVRTLTGHPVAAATVGTMLTGVAVTTAVYSTDLPIDQGPPAHVVVSTAPTPTITVTRTPRAVQVTQGGPESATAPTADAPSEAATQRRVSLQAGAYQGRYVMVGRGETDAKVAFPDLRDPRSRARATFEVVPGLADRRCLSFRLPDGRYLRHRQWHLVAWGEEQNPLYRADATFCPRPGPTSGTVQLRSYNYPDRAIRHREWKLWVEPVEQTPLYAADSSWRVEEPLQR
ncbi:MAG: sigma-70 family RNA polymerase sigma factor [Kineosporiaceae bacterium]